MKKYLKIIIPLAVVLVLALGVLFGPYLFVSGEIHAANGTETGNLRYRFNPITGVLVVYGQGEISGSWEFWERSLDYKEIETFARHSWYQERVQTVIVLSQSASHEYLALHSPEDMERVGGLYFPNLDTVYLADTVSRLSPDLLDNNSNSVTVYFDGDAPEGWSPLEDQDLTCRVVYRSGAQGFAEWGDQATAGFVPGWFWLLF